MVSHLTLARCASAKRGCVSFWYYFSLMFTSWKTIWKNWLRRVLFKINVVIPAFLKSADSLFIKNPLSWTYLYHKQKPRSLGYIVGVIMLIYLKPSLSGTKPSEPCKFEIERVHCTMFSDWWFTWTLWTTSSWNMDRIFAFGDTRRCNVWDNTFLKQEKYYLNANVFFKL